jgi:hypothetical protein
MRVTRRAAMVVPPMPATVLLATLHVCTPPNDPPVLALHSCVVARPRGQVFKNVVQHGNDGRDGQNGVCFALDLRMQHPLIVLYARVTTPAEAGTWARGKILFAYLVREFSQPGS